MATRSRNGQKFYSLLAVFKPRDSTPHRGVSLRTVLIEATETYRPPSSRIAGLRRGKGEIVRPERASGRE
ncbi:MAG: hypothetical protein UY52_C0035G0007 [Parcubacteria group bacterium GW2011_GWC2_49_9]|nr:MAG: hypothetical protein UY34_C0011G0049 [Parcubacteria group bacterium GW2011_GWA2_48_9]KKW13914.1 MAG: hypothetical protein UY52_C0035G0007 [Parcubacteria group bacterium GW2011_GWC2_49_9]